MAPSTPQFLGWREANGILGGGKAAREIRDTLKVKENPQLLKKTKRAENILHSNQLDGRSISKDFTPESKYILEWDYWVFLMIGASPIYPSTGLQALIARYLGDNTDEELMLNNTTCSPGSFLR